MKVPKELYRKWDELKEYGDFKKIAELASTKTETVTPDVIKKVFQRQSGDERIVGCINNYFEQKKKFHRKLFRQLENA